MGTVGQGCSQFIQFLNLFLGMCCIAKVVFILAVYNASKPCFSPFVPNIGIYNWFKYQISKPISRRLLARGETCLYGFPTYLQGIVCQGSACLYGLQTYHQGIVCQGSACLYGLRTYLQGIVCQGSACLYGLRTYLQGIVCQGCSLFTNLPKGDSW